jgi:hypothetical protein
VLRESLSIATSLLLSGRGGSFAGRWPNGASLLPSMSSQCAEAEPIVVA